MAAKQKDIAVSEFFAKNRHLLGFDNPRKALLTTRKGGGAEFARCLRRRRAFCRTSPSLLRTFSRIGRRRPSNRDIA